MYHRINRLVALLGIALLITIATPQQTLAQTAPRCFPETGYCIEGRIREFWEKNGGLPVFGFPTSQQRIEVIEGIPLQVQWFERNRLELHPENARPYDVLLGRLGVDRLNQQGRNWFTFPKSGPKEGCRYFPETEHNVCGVLFRAWRSNGLELDGRRGMSEAENLALLGLPLSDDQIEVLGNGQSYRVQWFERGRLEIHPENAAPFDVLLGLLGNETTSGGTSAPPAPPAPPAAQTLQIGPIWDSENDQRYSLAITLHEFRWSNGTRYSKPSPGNVYVVVLVTIQNLGPGTAYSKGAERLKVRDANGAVRSAIYVSELVENCYQEPLTLPAGAAVQGCISYEVPITGGLDLIYAPFQYDAYGPGRYVAFNLRP